MAGSFQLIGMAVGSFFGPIGMAVGGAVGGLVDQEVFGKAQKGPRVDEFRATGSAVGAPIIRGYGNNRLGGELIWFGRIREKKKTKKVGGIGGFGGQKVVNYEYYATFAVGLQEGPGVCLRRIRINGKVWWEDPGVETENPDYLDQQRRVIEFGPESLTEEELAQYNATALKVATSEGRSEYFTFYPGSADQAPDPIIQGYLGTSAPAYRDTAYVVFKELSVTEYGGALPLIEFETVNGTGGEGQSTVFWVPQQLVPWVEGTKDPRDARNGHEYQFPLEGGAGPWRQTLDEAISDAEAELGLDPNTFSRGEIGWSINPTASGVSPFDHPDPGELESVNMHFQREMLVGLIEDFYSRADILASGNGPGAPGFEGMYAMGVERNQYVYIVASTGGPGGSPSGVFIITRNDTPPPGDFWNALNNEIDGGVTYTLFGAPDLEIVVRREPKCPADTCEEGDPLPENPDYCVIDGNIIPQVTFAETADGDFLQLAPYVVDTGVVVQYPLGPVLNLDYAPHAALNTEAFWVAQYEAAVSAGEMEAGGEYGVDYPVSVATVCAGELDAPGPCDAVEVFVADVIEAECLKRNLTLADLNTSLVTDGLWGFKLERNVSGREAIEQLRTYSWLDAVESDGLLKFVPRGLDAVATLTLEDLGAHEYGNTRPPALEVTRIDDIQLPKEVRVSYIDKNAAFQPGQQYDRRLVTDAVNTQDIQLGIAMDGDRAKKIATIALYDQWAARKALQFNLGPRWLALEPTDCVLIPDLGSYTRVRIDSDDLALPGLRTLQSVRDEQSLYDRESSGPTPQVPDAAEDNTVAQGPTTVVILDLPPMGVGDDDAGYWVAMYGTLPTWQAASGFRSLDGGTTYEQVVESGAAIAGTIVEPFDGSTLTVKVYGGELLSTTPAAAAAGTNRFAMGLDGRWLIGTFETVTDLGDGQYLLSDVTAGLFNTDWLLQGSPTGYGQVGDAFVMLETASRVPEEDSVVGTEVKFRGVTSGTVFENAPDITFTARGNARGFVTGFGLDAPPLHVNGTTYVVGTSPLTEWSGVPNYIAHDVDGQWLFELPASGRQVRTTSGARYEYSGGSPGSWFPITSTVPDREIGSAGDGIGVENPDGVAGPPTIVLKNDLEALEALTGEGLAYRVGTDDWVLIGNGVEGEVLTSHGPGVVPTWETPGGGGGGGGLVLLEQHTASASAALNFTTFISATYDTYVFELVNVQPANSGAHLLVQFGSGGGPTYDTGGNYDHESWSHNQAGGTAATGSGADTSIEIGNTMSNVSTKALCGSMKLYDPQSTNFHKSVVFATRFPQSSGNTTGREGAGSWLSTSVTTAIRFLMSSGNIAAGTIRVYGVAK